MDLDALLALTGVAISMTWTPGPNNMMLAASGATFGWRRSLPHAMGVTIGFPIMLILVALGLGQVFTAFPWLATALTWVGFAAMIWFAWRIARADPATGESQSRPLSFFEAAAFQWVNPKAWTFAIWVTASYVGGPDAAWAVLIAACVFLMSGLGSSQAWAIFGTKIGQLLGRGWRLSVFNATMALLLVGCALVLLFDSF